MRRGDGLPRRTFCAQVAAANQLASIASRFTSRYTRINLAAGCVPCPINCRSILSPNLNRTSPHWKRRSVLSVLTSLARSSRCGLYSPVLNKPRHRSQLRAAASTPRPTRAFGGDVVGRDKIESHDQSITAGGHVLINSTLIVYCRRRSRRRSSAAGKVSEARHHDLRPAQTGRDRSRRGASPAPSRWA